MTREFLLGVIASIVATAFCSALKFYWLRMMSMTSKTSQINVNKHYIDKVKLEFSICFPLAVGLPLLLHIFGAELPETFCIFLWTIAVFSAFLVFAAFGCMVEILDRLSQHPADNAAQRPGQ